jgi:hypothetical protein
MKVKGTFEVSLSPLESSFQGVGELNIGRLSIDKKFEGDLSATSKGEMLSARSEDGQAGYVALEQVIGQLDGKSGSFALQHFGTWSPPNQSLKLEVVPGSGRGELSGLSGTMEIIIEEGQHYYEFDYQIG